MDTFNALLKAQAEVRRRQLMQQANGANSAGNGRQGQDLSSLFDRELKRQQRTNYEAGSPIEQQAENQKTDESALDRIRDLARRQEELGRRQRELADGGLSAEELKRQLEKLTREQEQLRQQAENLARELARQQSQPSPQQRSGQQSSKPQASGQQPSERPQPGQTQGSGGSSLRDAVEQMRDAASQLARQDPASAAARSDQAARQLRDLENRMQTGSPDARRRALGDLQLESQQVAEAQRRIAREADRLDREGGGTADARRRLSGEKEQLADRVDALQQSARRLGTDAKSAAADRATVNEAARDLESQQLGARMRQGARDMRDQPSKASAGAEQQLADALDRVARRLNGVDAGGAKGETQRLAEQLDQVRDARDRLARLEQQVRQAQRDQAAAQEQQGAAGRSAPRSGDGQQGSASGDLQRLQQEYAQEAHRTREMVDRLQRGTPESSLGGATPEQHEWSRSAPGTEAWKQDYGEWDGLRKDVTRALEHYETGVADKLSRALTADRLRAGGSDRVPDDYQGRIAKYFEALARKPGAQ
jgi:archaellum component FlaC